MEVAFRRIDAADVERLADWLPRHSWPYHGQTHADATWVRERAKEGYFFGATLASFWVFSSEGAPLGIVRVFDLLDVTPLLDLRIGESMRGRGIGTSALRFATRYVFEATDAHRLGGYTRHDNVAMARVFEKCGYAREAHHRQAWRVEGGSFMDAVGYAVLRSEWSPSDCHVRHP